jgi:uncharacterized protein YqkB
LVTIFTSDWVTIFLNKKVTIKLNQKVTIIILQYFLTLKLMIAQLFAAKFFPHAAGLVSGTKRF